MPQVTSLFLHSTRALTPLWTCSDEGCQHLPAQRPTPAHLNTTSSIALTQSQPSAPHQALPHAASHSSTLALQLHQLGPPPPRAAAPFLPSRPHPALSLPPAPPYPTPPFSPPSPAMPHAQGQASVLPRPPRPLTRPRAPCPAPLPQASPGRKASSSAPPRPHSPARRPALPGGRALELQREGLLDDAVVHLEQDHVGAGDGERLSARRGRREPSPLRAPGTRPSLRRRFRSRARASLPARLPRSRAVAAVMAHARRPPVLSRPP